MTFYLRRCGVENKVMRRISEYPPGVYCFMIRIEDPPYYQIVDSTLKIYRHVENNVKYSSDLFKTETIRNNFPIYDYEIIMPYNKITQLLYNLPTNLLELLYDTSEES